MTDPTDNMNMDELFDNDGEVDLYVDFSSEEAGSESRDMEPLPSGKYLCQITKVDVRECGPESKNPGKPFYAIEFTVLADKAGGQYEKRKCWTNAMLFNPALYTIVNIMKAIDFGGGKVSEGRGRVPRPSELIDRIMVVQGIKMGEQKDKSDPSKTYAPKFEPKGYFKEGTWGGTASSGTATGKKAASSDASSLLS
jgi:hypothetical protein